MSSNNENKIDNALLYEVVKSIQAQLANIREDMEHLISAGGERDARAKRWLDANRAAISAHNERVAERGTLLTPAWLGDAAL